MNNTTPILPVGSTNHGDPELLCTPSNWKTTFVFFFGNYLLHAATARPLPGESRASQGIAIIMTLLFPATGVLRGVKAILSGAKFTKSDLKAAARAGAFCTVVREGATGLGREVDIFSKSILATKIHGSFTLPADYKIIHVPADAVIERSQADPESRPFLELHQYRERGLPPATTIPSISNRPVLSSNYNMLKSLVSLAQAAFAIMTLYQTRGPQISQYGYAAFGLSVTPYALMSVVNLLGSLLCPEYPALYLVESDAMVDARMKHGGVFEGTVRGLEIDMDKLQRGSHGAVYDRRSLFLNGLACLIGLLPVLIVLLLSHLNAGNSTYSQRSWLMTWMVFGGLFGPIIEWRRDELINYGSSTWAAQMSTVGFSAFFAVPAIGGFVVVGQMLAEYGACSRLN